MGGIFETISKLSVAKVGLQKDSFVEGIKHLLLEIKFSVESERNVGYVYVIEISRIIICFMNCDPFENKQQRIADSKNEEVFTAYISLVADCLSLFT